MTEIPVYGEIDRSAKRTTPKPDPADGTCLTVQNFKLTYTHILAFIRHQWHTLNSA